MNKNLNEIIESQKVLDKAIQVKHHVNYDSVYDELKLALFVELGELANEVRCFKFWSLKQPSEKDVILEEYVDGIHFISSLAIAKQVEINLKVNDINFSINQDNTIPKNKKHLTKLFNSLFSKMHQLDSKEGITEWFNEYLSLGHSLGFSFKEISEAYFKKNQINFKRQNENY